MLAGPRAMNWRLEDNLSCKYSLWEVFQSMRKAAQVNELKKKKLVFVFIDVDAWIDNRFIMAKCLSEYSKMNDFMCRQTQIQHKPQQKQQQHQKKKRRAQCSPKSIWHLCVRDQLMLRFILFDFLPPLSINNIFFCMRARVCVCCSFVLLHHVSKCFFYI